MLHALHNTNPQQSGKFPKGIRCFACDLQTLVLKRCTKNRTSMVKAVECPRKSVYITCDDGRFVMGQGLCEDAFLFT